MNKVLILVTCLIFVTVQAQIVNYLKAGHKCQKELGMDRKIADRIVKGNYVEETEENQCFVKCLYQTFGIIDEDGEFLPEIARLKVPKPLVHFKEMASDWVDECQDEDGDTICEKAFRIWECFVRLKTQNTQEIIKKLTSGNKRF